MNRKLKLALAALLGFSAACSSVKNAPKQGPEKKGVETDSLTVRDQGDRPRIVVMYGVRQPDGRMVTPLKEESSPKPAAQSQHYEVDPVVEKPQD